MALKIRLARHGAKKRPFYWIVIADARAPRDGKFKEKVGSYNPLLSREDKNRLIINEEKVRHWLAHGAQPTDRMRRFLADKKILPPIEIRETPKKSAPGKKAQEREKERAAKEELKHNAEA